jgi:hypothetical protein
MFAFLMQAKEVVMDNIHNCKWKVHNMGNDYS